MSCVRCGVEDWDRFGRCRGCGVHKDRPVRKHRARKIGGKRGRNSGTTGTAKTKR